MTSAAGDGQLQRVRLDCIDTSPFQVRLVFADDEIEALADSILASGLIHEPRGRPHPTKPGRIELMPGEMRLRALDRLVRRGQADGVLDRDAEGHWLVPVMVDRVDDERAERMLASENADRTELSAWEWAWAYAAHRERRKQRGLPAGVREIAASRVGGKKFQTVGEYLQVADALSTEVLASAGVVAGGEPDHGRLARLPLAALRRVVRAVGLSRTAGAECLLNELKRVGDAEAADHLRKRERALQPTADTGFQVNIRHPLASLGARQAARYLSRMVPVLAALAGRAMLDRDEAERIASALEGSAEAVRARSRVAAEGARGGSAARRRTAVAERRRPRRSRADPGEPLTSGLGGERDARTAK